MDLDGKITVGCFGDKGAIKDSRYTYSWIVVNVLIYQCNIRLTSHPKQEVGRIAMWQCTAVAKTVFCFNEKAR